MHSHVLYSILYDSMYSPLVSPRASWSTMRLWRRVLITCLMHSWDSSLERILARLLWRPEHKLIYGVLGWVLLTILHNSWDIYFFLSLYCCIEHVVGLKHVNCSLLVLQISPFSDCIMLMWEKIPGSPCFSVLQAMERWVEPGNEVTLAWGLHTCTVNEYMHVHPHTSRYKPLWDSYNARTHTIVDLQTLAKTTYMIVLKITCTCTQTKTWYNISPAMTSHKHTLSVAKHIKFQVVPWWTLQQEPVAYAETPYNQQG